MGISIIQLEQLRHREKNIRLPNPILSIANAIFRQLSSCEQLDDNPEFKGETEMRQLGVILIATLGFHTAAAELNCRASLLAPEPARPTNLMIWPGSGSQNFRIDSEMDSVFSFNAVPMVAGKEMYKLVPTADNRPTLKIEFEKGEKEGDDFTVYLSPNFSSKYPQIIPGGYADATSVPVDLPNGARGYVVMSCK